MSKFKGIEYDKPLTDVTIITICPYCNKKFLNKNSYRNHITKKYCTMCDFETGKSFAEEIGIPLNYFKED